MKDKYPYYLANKAVYANQDLSVYDKYSDELIAQVALADEDVINHALARGSDAATAMGNLPPYERQKILYQCVQGFQDRAEELAMVLCKEAGKPIKDSRGEVDRLIDTFKVAAEEAVRINGEVINLEISPRAKGYQGFTKRVPVGLCSFISPFNFPLNLVAHKVAPAIAAGCPFVLKPASLTPVSALIMGDILSQTDLPEGAFSILPCTRSSANLLVQDERIKLLSFTGSPDVGWALKAQAGKKKVVLELGGNAACLVDEDADVEDAVQRNIIGAFYQSGQSCISVQRILVHDSIYSTFKEKLLGSARGLKSGDPKDESTFIGPVISEKEALRIESWLNKAVAEGATVLCGGKRQGSVVEATVLENVSRQSELYQQEAFGPVVMLEAFKDFDDALELINDSKFGLQAGVFTRDIYKAQKSWDRLEVGGVIIGDVPSWRVDNMPYGGVKDSGIGREGVRHAIEDMTEPRLMVIRTPPGQ